MTEGREGESITETSEQVGNRLVEFVQNAEFGSPEYQAVSDYIHLKSLENSLVVEMRNARNNEKEPERKNYWESQARITEQEIALHRTQIYNYRSRLMGYDTAYTYVGVGFEHDLYDAAHREADGLYAEDPVQQDFYTKDIHSNYFGKAESILDRKKE